MRRDTNKWESSDNYDNFRQLFSTLKSMETASRTRNALGERMFETTWTTRDNFFKVRRPTGRRAWETGGEEGVFQWLEKKFPMVGKFRSFFPMIGKIFRRFSNDWKKF